MAAYALLWGHTSIVVHRAFVESAAGTALLLPARIVLWGIRRAETAGGTTFEFSGSTWWMGAAAALVGAAILALTVWATAAAVAWVREAQDGSESRSRARASGRSR